MLLNLIFSVLESLRNHKCMTSSCLSSAVNLISINLHDCEANACRKKNYHNRHAMSTVL